MASEMELESRLQALEAAQAAAAQRSKEDSFINSYGSQFSNDRSLGVAILNELERRGVDTSAADEAVANIIDELRTELRGIMSLIDAVQDKAIQQSDKLDTITNVIQQEVAGNPAASGDIQPNIPGAIEMPLPPEEAPLPPEIQALDPNAEFIPQEEIPEEQAPLPEMPAPEEQAPLPEMPAPEESAPEQAVPSDVRIKVIKNPETGTTTTIKTTDSSCITKDELSSAIDKSKSLADYISPSEFKEALGTSTKGAPADLNLSDALSPSEFREALGTGTKGTPADFLLDIADYMDLFSRA